MSVLLTYYYYCCCCCCSCNVSSSLRSPILTPSASFSALSQWPLQNVSLCVSHTQRYRRPEQVNLRSRNFIVAHCCGNFSLWPLVPVVFGLWQAENIIVGAYGKGSCSSYGGQEKTRLESNSVLQGLIPNEAPLKISSTSWCHQAAARPLIHAFVCVGGGT